MLRVLKGKRSSYYEWRNRSREPDHALVRAAIHEAHEVSDRSYGVRRVVPELRSQGFACGKKLVARLMREEGLQGLFKRTKPYGKARQPEVQAVPNDLDRQFLVQSPNTVWVSDITYIWTRSGWVYLAVILDLYSRMVVGWSVSVIADTSLVLEALRAAVLRRRPGRGVMMHTDQGCQYTSLAWRGALETMGFRLSMSGRGQCWDNAPMESWNGILKRESRVITTLQSGLDEVSDVLFRWIEGWYNSRRRHSKLGYSSPAEHEVKWAA